MNKSKKEEKKAYAKGRKAGKSDEEINKEMDRVRFSNRLLGHEVHPSHTQDWLKGWQEEERRSKEKERIRKKEERKRRKLN